MERTIPPDSPAAIRQPVPIRLAGTDRVKRIERNSGRRNHAAISGHLEVAVRFEDVNVSFKSHPVIVAQLALAIQKYRAGETDWICMK